MSLCPSEWGGSPHLVIASFRLQQAPKFVIASLAEQGVAISQHQPEHGKAFGESVSACHALSVTFGDSSPRGRAKVASLPAMTREGGACKFVTMPLRMGWVSPSCHCILPVAAGSQVCHCEPCGARRGNLAAPAGTRESFWRIRKCLPCPLSHLR